MKCRSILFVVLWPLLGVGAESQAAMAFSARGGLRHSPEALFLTPDPAAPVYFTTNGAPASPANGVRYSEPLRLVTTTTVRAVTAANVAAEQIITFIFPEMVVRQTGAGFPIHWGTHAGSTVLADYEMDPEVVTNAAYRDGMVVGLEALPSLALTLDPADLFGEERGLYTHPQESGED